MNWYRRSTPCRAAHLDVSGGRAPRSCGSRRRRATARFPARRCPDFRGCPAVDSAAAKPATPPRVGECPKIVATDAVLPGSMDRVARSIYDADIALPKSRTWDTLPIGPVVVVTPRSICVEGEAVARVVDGRLLVEELRGHEIPALRERIAPLREALAERERARGEEPVDGLVLFADAGTRQSTMIDIFYTANRAGFRAYLLVLDADVPAMVPFETGLELEPPKYTVDGKAPYFRPKQKLRIGIDVDTLTLKGEQPIPFDHARAADVVSLTELAHERTGGAAYDRRTASVAIVTAGNEVTLGRVIAVVSAVAGRACDLDARTESDPKRCAFPRTIVEAGE